MRITAKVIAPVGIVFVVFNSIYLCRTPIFAVVLALLILHEISGWRFWIGGVLILGGIAPYLVGTERKKQSVIYT